MTEKNILTIKFKIFDKSIEECRAKIDKIIDQVKEKDEKFVIHMINNHVSNVNKLKNMSNVIYLSQFLSNIKKRIIKIKIYGKSSLVNFAVGIVKSFVGYNIEEIVEYHDYIE